MKTLTFEQVESAFHKWAGILSNNRFEYWELINAAWLMDRGVRSLPQSKIKFASARIKYDMIAYMRKELKSRRRKQRETVGKRFKHLPYMINFSDMGEVNQKSSDGEYSPFDSLLESPQIDNCEQKDFMNYIMNCISMTRTEKLIMKLCYMEGYTQKEIAKICGWTESRISQLHSNLILRLSEKDYSKAI